MPKQDRTAARTVADLERRYNFGKRFSEVMGVADDARDTAWDAMEEASAPAGSLGIGAGENLYFDSVESLNAFVESVAPTMKDHTQKVYSVTCDFDPYYSYGIITMSRGIASDHFPEIVVELSVDGRLLYRWANSDGSGGDGVYDPEDFYWAKPGGGVDNGKWTESYAPAGYGLGGAPTKTITLSEMDNTFSSGWYWLSEFGTTLNGVYFNYATVFVHGMEAGACVQEIRPLAQNCVLTRYASGGTFQPWECPNPPTKLGVEYRTTERWNGHPVYTKLVSFGYMPNATEKIVDWEPDSGTVSKVVRYAGTNDQGDALPYVTAYANYRLAVGPSYIVINTNADKSAVMAYVQIWYTKN